MGFLFKRELLTHSLANLQFPILPWEELGFVEPCVHAVLGKAGVNSAYWVTVRMGVAEKDFEGAFGFGHFFHHEGSLRRTKFWFDFPTLKLYNRKPVKS